MDGCRCLMRNNSGEKTAENPNLQWRRDFVIVLNAFSEVKEYSRCPDGVSRVEMFDKE